MKEIVTEKYKKASRKDLPSGVEHKLPSFRSNTDTEEDVKKDIKSQKRCIKTKKLPQLGVEVEDITIQEIID